MINLRKIDKYPILLEVGVLKITAIMKITDPSFIKVKNVKQFFMIRKLMLIIYLRTQAIENLWKQKLLPVTIIFLVVLYIVAKLFFFFNLLSRKTR